MSTPVDVNEDTKCFECRQEKRWHYRVTTHEFIPPPDEPESHEMVPAMVVTSWTCHECGYEQDVWGEGAIHSWMDCQAEGCHASSWLDFTMGINQELGYERATEADR